MQLTQWHKGTEKPVRDGVYERLYDEGQRTEEIYYCRFEHGIWFSMYENKLEAARTTVISAFQDEIKWRGITKDGK